MLDLTIAFCYWNWVLALVLGLKDRPLARNSSLPYECPIDPNRQNRGTAIEAQLSEYARAKTARLSIYI